MDDMTFVNIKSKEPYILDLKSELRKKQIEAIACKQKAKVPNTGLTMKEKTQVNICKKEKSSKQLLSETEQNEEKEINASRAKLEAKAKLYDKIVEGKLGDVPSDMFLVDFENKAVEGQCVSGKLQLKGSVSDIGVLSGENKGKSQYFTESNDCTIDLVQKPMIRVGIPSRNKLQNVYRADANILPVSEFGPLKPKLTLLPNKVILTSYSGMQFRGSTKDHDKKLRTVIGRAHDKDINFNKDLCHFEAIPSYGHILKGGMKPDPSKIKACQSKDELRAGIRGMPALKGKDELQTLL
ncbi:hypothetical protein QYM36_010380 [Artemia franciscana]|uniref:Uncharacterized protein n=1 Tax=Artemia franciscana TaxID=6661 RepID=A0AA88I5P7_ARTSF|nr:hypothetical protein QYM36_010380 [Artemia franciscana]